MARTHLRRAAVLVGMIGSLSTGLWSGHGHRGSAHAGEHLNSMREVPRFEPPLHMPPTSDYLGDGAPKKTSPARSGASFANAAFFSDPHGTQEDIEEAIEVPQAIEERLFSAEAADPALLDLTGCDLTDKLCISSGSANQGRLINGIPFPELAGVQIRAGKGAIYGTPETIAAIRFAVNQVQKDHPGAPALVLGDISRANGGRFSPHVSHQSGRDVDLGFYHTVPVQEFISASPSNLDIPRTWALIEALMEDHKVEYIFIDSYVQSLLYRYVKYELQAPQAYLEQVFAYGGGRRALIRHAPGHRNHIHARFWSPIAVAAGMGLDLRPSTVESFDYVALDAFKRGTYLSRDQFERADWSHEPLEPEAEEATAVAVTWKKTRISHRVRSGDTLSTVAQRYHVDTDDLARLNRISTRSVLRTGQRLVVEQRVKVEVPVPQGDALASRESAQASGRSPLNSAQEDRGESRLPAPASDEASTVLDVMYVSQDDVQAAFSREAENKRRSGPSSESARESQASGVTGAVASGLASGVGSAPGGRTDSAELKLDTYSHVPTQLEASVALATQAESSRSAGSGAAARARAAADRAAKSSTRSVQRYSYARVGQGDNLWKIARAHDTSVDELLKLNGLSRNSPLKPGQRLKVRSWEERVPASTGAARRGR